MFNNKNILITGATGSFGKKFIKKIQSIYKPKKNNCLFKRWVKAVRHAANF